MTEGPINLKFMGAKKSPVPSVKDALWITGFIKTPAGELPRVSVSLSNSDRLGSWKARWGMGRMRYTVAPGLYAVGNPTPESPLFASANYKMSFDRLRSTLGGMDAWVLVLDTKGINVWCAAGKGTFGTAELASRLPGVAEVVTHRKIIVPQLGAPGVSAHEVKRRTGFRVVYGPVRAEDIPAFMEAGMRATPEMRRVRFPFRDRVTLIPMEMIPGLKYTLPVAAALFFLAGFGGGGYSLDRAIEAGAASAAFMLAAYFGGTAISPALLPWIPGRAFSLKGAFVGAAILLGLWALAPENPAFPTLPSRIAWALMVPAVSSFFAMNFTGASTYTSLSGVKREMKIAVPLQAVGAIAGIGLWVAGLFA